MSMEQKNSNVDVFASIPGISSSQRFRLEQSLFKYANELVQKFNIVVESEALYLVSFASCWVLYGRPTDHDADRVLLYGTLSVEDLVRLVSKLEGIFQDII